MTEEIIEPEIVEEETSTTDCKHEFEVKYQKGKYLKTCSDCGRLILVRRWYEKLRWQIYFLYKAVVHTLRK